MAVRRVRQDLRKGVAVRQGVRPTSAVVGRAKAHQAQEAQAHQAQEAQAQQAQEAQANRAQEAQANRAQEAQANRAQAAQANQAQTSTSMLWQPLWAHFWDFRLAEAAVGMLLPLQAPAAVIPPLRARVPLQWPWIP